MDRKHVVRETKNLADWEIVKLIPMMTNLLFIDFATGTI